MSTFETTDACSWAGKPVARRIADAYPRHRIVVTGEITHTTSVQIGTAPAYRCVLNDGTGQLDLLFIGRRAVPGIVLGTVCGVEGTAAADGDRMVVWNPLYVLKARADQKERADEVPVARSRAG
jgi:hypothetical protein